LICAVSRVAYQGLKKIHIDLKQDCSRQREEEEEEEE
jgi:hypothetical protein